MEDSNVYQIFIALLIKRLTSIFLSSRSEVCTKSLRKTNYQRRKMRNFAKGKSVLNFEKAETKCPMCNSSPDLENCNLCNKKPQKKANSCLIKIFVMVAYFLFRETKTHGFVKAAWNVISVRKDNLLLWMVINQKVEDMRQKKIFNVPL